MSWDYGAGLASYVTLEDIATASEDYARDYDTPVLKLIADERKRGYDTIYAPLTTDKWRTRWREMCLAPSDMEDDAEAAVRQQQRAEAWRSQPAFLEDEVTITRLGELFKNLVIVYAFTLVFVR
jgi:protein arginine N-methyltransferase 5